jgi:hypothetical protein
MNIDAPVLGQSICVSQTPLKAKIKVQRKEKRNENRVIRDFKNKNKEDKK